VITEPISMSRDRQGDTDARVVINRATPMPAS